MQHGTKILHEEEVDLRSPLWLSPPEMLTSAINPPSLPIARPFPVAAHPGVLPKTVPLPLGGPPHRGEDDAGGLPPGLQVLPPGLAGRGEAGGQDYTEAGWPHGRSGRCRTSRAARRLETSVKRSRRYANVRG